MLINKEQVPNMDSIFNKIPNIGKTVETPEQIQKRTQDCATELQILMQEYNCAIQVMPGLMIDNEARLRVNPQVGVRYVESQ